MLRLFLAFSFVGLILAVLMSGFLDFLELRELQKIYLEAQIWRDHHSLFFIAAFVFFYSIFVFFCLPGITFVHILAGATFGWFWGSFYSLFALSLGSLGACLFSRFILRDWVENKFSKKVRAFDAHFKKEGAVYLLSLRLIPPIPYFVVNLVMGATQIKARVFFGVTFVGMAPVVYINGFLGDSLAETFSEMTSLGELISSEVIAALCLLALFPLGVRKLLLPYLRPKKN